MENFQDPRAEIRKLLADNAGMITGNLCSMMSRNVEDMVAAGIDRLKVTDAALTVGVVHHAAVLGPARMSVLLRDIADHFDQLALENSHQFDGRH